MPPPPPATSAAPGPAARLHVTIVGAGFAGIAQAVQLKRQLGGRVAVQVVEKADGPGGIWRSSTWPGAQVDVPIHLYSLYSDPKSDWNKVYADQSELLEYLEGLIEKHNIGPWFTYNTSYVSSTWDPTTQQHTITLQPATGDAYTVTSNILISANGPLSTPQLPNIPGLASFKGESFHNLRWRGDLDFAGKKIAVVGNGSSGIQFVPGLAGLPGTEVVHFIRSGGYFFPKKNPEFSAWDKFVFGWVPGARLWYRWRVFLQIGAYWVDGRGKKAATHDALEAELLGHLRKTAPPEYLQALTPTYPLGCKRAGLDAGWLQCLHRDNVELRSSPIARISETTITAEDGSTYDPDIIIFATGSDVARQGVGLNVGLHGEGGKELRAYWEEIGGPQSFKGVAVPGFPNVFHVIGPNAICIAWGWTIGNQSTFIARLVKEMVDNDIGSLQPRMDPFVAENVSHQKILRSSTMVSSLCTSWWRIEGAGRASVPNSLAPMEHWWATRATHWPDWLAVERAAPGRGGGKPRAVDVRARVRRRRVLQAAGLSAVVGAAWWLGRERGWKGVLGW